MRITRVIFNNDNDTEVKLIKHKFSNIFCFRDDHEVMFRKIHSYLIKKGVIKGNVIDLGAWIGDNSILWAKQLNSLVYAIDPSSENIDFIEKMAKHNFINNVITIKKAVSDKNEIISTNHSINHCSFEKGDAGKIQLECVSLDYLYENEQIKNIDFIHLDVEGFEFNVIKGSTKLIDESRPIITFEQHLTTDNYLELSSYLYDKNYDIYLINETLKGCRIDCRNILAVPVERKIDIDEINEYLESPILLALCKHDIVKYDSKLSCTVYGEYINQEYLNVKSVEVNENLYLFCFHDTHFTKIIAIDSNDKFINGKYLQGYLDLNCKNTIINAYNSSKHQINDEKLYNIKNLQYL